MIRQERKQRYLATAGGSAGFTAIELVLVMSIFMIVIMISADSFERVVKLSGNLASSSESNTQGIVGLEIMRSDLEHAGFGLPWPAASSSGFVLNFSESTQAANSLANGIDPQAFNDSNIDTDIDPMKAPKAIQSAQATGAEAWENGRDYLVIKSTAIGMNDTAKRWGYLEGLGASSSIKLWGNVTDDIAPGDRVITLKTTTVDKKPYRDLVGTSTSAFFYAVPAAVSGKLVPPAAYQATTTDNYLVYGVSGGDLRAPYNRVDYYIKRPAEAKDMPARCAPGTGLLYKGEMSQSTGKASEYPLLDCVADMQVVYSLDTTAEGGVNAHGGEDVLSALSADQIRTQLKEIRVYILAQEGGRDLGFNYPTSTIRMGAFGYGRDYDLTLLNGIGDDWKHYRWKVYNLAVVPKNINN